LNCSFHGDENLNVFINNGSDARLFRSDRDGIIKITVGRDDVLAFVSNIQVTCHPYGKDEHALRKYRVSDILEHGLPAIRKSAAMRFLCAKRRAGLPHLYQRVRSTPQTCQLITGHSLE